MAEDDFVEFLSGQAQSDTAAYHQFMLLFDAQGTAIHSFFEGDEDPAYYLPWIRQRAHDRPIQNYICGGKWNVVSVRTQILESSYSLERCLFFIDRDFDNFIGTQAADEEHTYITDFYSIESNIATNEARDIILLDIVNLSRADPEYARVSVDIEKACKSFESIMRPMMAWTIALRASRKTANLNNVKLNKLFKIDEHGKVKRAKRAFFLYRKAVAPSPTEVSASDMRKWKAVIASEPCKGWLRGKFELWVFESATIASLTALVNRRKAAGLRAPRIPAALRERALFDELGGRLLAPPTLKEFLTRRIPI